MTRVWSLSTTEETEESQLFFVWKNESNLMSFDSGYESSLNVNSIIDVNQEIEEIEFDNNCHHFEELEHFSNVNEETNRYSEMETTFSHSNRPQSSPIPIPHTRRQKKSSINHSKSSLISHSSHSFASTTLSLQSIESVHCLVGHPPYGCGCVRGYRNPYLINNTSQSSRRHSESANLHHLSLSCNNRSADSSESTERPDIISKKRCYPLPDIVSSSQNRTLMNEIIREIGSDLRRMSKDFIATRDQKIESREISLIRRVMRVAIPYIPYIPYILKEISQLF